LYVSSLAVDAEFEWLFGTKLTVSVLAAFFTLTGAVLVLIIARWGIDMQRWMERRVPLPEKS
jgi:hypothetical protein